MNTFAIPPRRFFLGGDRDGSLEDRILHAVERRANGYEERSNMILSTAAQLWRSKTLRQNYARYQRGLRKDLSDWLPELEQLTRGQREAVDAIASFEMWHRLRYHQGLDMKAAVGVIVDYTACSYSRLDWPLMIHR